jgi:putative ABC transport system substrate-binding protein
MKEILPAGLIGILWDPATGFTQLRALEAVAAVMNIELAIVEVRALADLDGAMVAASRNNIDALFMLSSPLIGGSSKLLADFTSLRRLPAVTLFPDFARSGGLMGYGPNISDGIRQIARMVAKVLQGAKPADLPIELPTKFELVVNLKTAKARDAHIDPARRRGDRMKRREFITLLGGTAAWPLVARAQQAAMPVIGYLSFGSPSPFVHFTAAFRKGLEEGGYVDGKNVVIEYRWAENQTNKLNPLASELVGQRVAVIVATGGSQTAVAAKLATSTIPIVFTGGGDPVSLGLVASLNQPGGNATGVTNFGVTLDGKRLELLRELIPRADVVAVLFSSDLPSADSQLRDIQLAAQTLGQTIYPVRVNSARDFEQAFASIVQRGAGALLVTSAALFTNRRDELVALASRHAVPAIYSFREFTGSGGLISYGTNNADGYRQAGVYTARILKGEKPANLPVMQPTKFELIVNLKTAKALGLDVPPTLLARADEVIE